MLLQVAAEAVDDSDISCSVPTEDEVKADLKKLKNGKAPDCCYIAPEMRKAGGPAMVTRLTTLSQSCWTNARFRMTGRKELSYLSTKEQGAGVTTKTTCGITLLSCLGNSLLTYSKSIKRRLIATRRKEQSGCTPHRFTINRICALNIILQGRREFQCSLWVA